MKTTRRVYGIGETILDILFRDNAPAAAIPGGSAFNGLISLGRAGVPVTFISELGNDKVGDTIRAFMQENGLTTDYVDCFPDGKSPVSLVFIDENNDTEYVVYKDYPAQRLEVAFPPIQEDDIFLFGAYYSLNPVLRPRILEFLEYARDRKAILYYDPNFRKPHAHEAMRLMPSVIENLEYADIVRGSDEDFFHLFGKRDMDEVYEQHISFYCKWLITTHGSEGVRLYTPHYREHYEVSPIEAVSTVGAGDNFNAGVLFGLLKANIKRDDLSTLNAADWRQIVSSGIEFATDVCQRYDNYISPSFASQLQKGLK
ncbi:carbohydrate kinase [Parabacteroides sp. OttesenSCG-928-N08]|nr:carbohydrate kinase [Parabacteroides sp. OttesenSCG-928-N08]